ncbi:MAG: extracellular solute-binding protein [Anaerolineales bacterium]|nr:extracellular solute-binding protein [Anaerolineales bacterium]MCZ2121749.1 extracellular solute-binding protein [Anaerolineales bacterium]
MKKHLATLFGLLIIASMILAACGSKSAAPTEAASGEKVKIRWFVGLGTGTDPEQVTTQEEVVKDFNASQDRIELVLEVVPYDAARDTLSTQIASGAGPDIVGPVGWDGSNGFHGQWLDIAPYLKELNFDSSIFDPALMAFYQTEEGQVGLPFAVFPGGMFYRPDMFDEAGLSYPPQVYGEQYTMPDGSKVDWNWETVTKIAKLLTVDENGKNATEEGFDRTKIVQVGYAPQYQTILGIGTFYGGAAKIYSGDAKGSYQSNVPDSWKEAWKWYYDGMYGAEPFIATGPLATAPEFGNEDVFNAGKSAMALSQTWYTCCLGDLSKSGAQFQIGIQPLGNADGKVHGRIDADTFRILKSSQHPKEAVEVLTYLVTTGGDKLLPVYGAMPAIASKTDAFFEKKSADYAFVTKESWNVFTQGLAYPDTPSAEQYLPNSIKAYARFATFLDLLNNTDNVDFDAEYQKLIDDINVLYNE